MPYLPVCAAKLSDLRGVSGPAILKPLDQYNDMLFVTGGEHAFACYLSGKFAGEGILQADTNGAYGMAIGPIEIEVDTDSAYAPGNGNKIPLSIFRRDDFVGLYVRTDRGRQVIMATLDSSNPVSAADPIGFTKWRAIYVHGEERIVVYEHDATPRD